MKEVSFARTIWARSALAIAQARQRDFDSAKATADGIGDNYLIVSKTRRLIAAAEAQAGKVEAAKATAEMIRDAPERAAALRAIATAQAWAEWDKGLKAVEDWVKDLADPSDRCRAYLGLAEVAAAQSQGRTKPDPVEEEDEDDD